MLSSTRALEPVDLVLFSNAADPELLDDLAALPLRAAHDARRIGARVSQSSGSLRLAPVAPLSPGGTYTLALPGAARVHGGESLGDGGPAFVAELVVASGPGAGAAWVASLPGGRSSGVAPNLSATFVALDGAAEGIDSGVWLEDADGLAVAVHAERRPCAEVEARAETCLALELDGALQSDTQYTLRSGRELTDAHGAPVEPLRAAFKTASAHDLKPPAFEPLRCLADEVTAAFGCVLRGDRDVAVRLRCDEPVRVEVRVAGLQVAQLSAAGDAELQLSGLMADAPLQLRVRAVDLAGNASESQLPLRTAPELAQLTISEVRADPEGREPAQEYVELHNFGSLPIALTGFTLSDAAGASNAIDASAPLAPGARVLLVADTFDASDAADVAPLPGVSLVRVGTSLTGGLANGGERLFLRDASGLRLAAAPMIAAAAGSCLQRVGDHLRSGSVEQFRASPCTPGE